MTKPLYVAGLILLIVGLCELADAARPDPWATVCETAPSVLDMSCEGIDPPELVVGNAAFWRYNLPSFVKGFYITGTHKVYVRPVARGAFSHADLWQIAVHEMTHYLIHNRDPGLLGCSNERAALAVEAEAAGNPDINDYWKEHTQCN